VIDQIENAILARVRAASDAGVLGYRYQTFETYPADWDEYLKDKSALAAPGIWVTFGGWRAVEAESMDRARVELIFGIVVMAENLRSETATRHGGPSPANEPGSYRLAVDAARLLFGQDLGLDMAGLRLGALHFVRRFPAWKERRVSMLAIELRTDVAFVALDHDDPAGLDDFLAFHANWDVPAHGNVDADPARPGAQIPADASADATDHLNLGSNE
jgi:phage gp37-like protein